MLDEEEHAGSLKARAEGPGGRTPAKEEVTKRCGNPLEKVAVNAKCRDLMGKNTEDEGTARAMQAGAVPRIGAEIMACAAKAYGELAGMERLSETLIMNHSSRHQGCVTNTNNLLDTLDEMDGKGGQDRHSRIWRTETPTGL